MLDQIVRMGFPTRTGFPSSVFLYLPMKARMIFQAIGWISLVLGILLCLLGLASLPAGGLMFALPFFFLMPGIVLTILGVLLLFFTRVRVSTNSESNET